jgi:hypothetical protein
MITEVVADNTGTDLGFYDSFAGAGILRNYWKPSLLQKVAAEFDGLEEDWEYTNTSNEVSRNIFKLYAWGQELRGLLVQMCHGEFVSMLEEFSGIKGLLPSIDRGTGYRQIDPGGFQRLHTVGNPTADGWVRMYVEVFLNETLEPTDGGEFMVYNNPELFSEASLPSINTQGLCTAPLFNHTVVVKTDPTTFYGSPIPLRSETPRRSIALCYVTKESPDNYVTPSQPIWWGA